MKELGINHEQRGFEYGVQHILSPVVGNLEQILKESLTLSSQEILILLNMGAIYIQGSRAQEKDLQQVFPLKTYLRVHTKPRRFLANDGLIKNRILFENENFIIVNKPSGLPCHPSVDNKLENLLTYLNNEYSKEFFLTHRLDVPTSGLIVFAKNKKYQSEFNKLLTERKIQKIYTAICTGKEPRLGLYTDYMITSPRAPKTLTKTPEPGTSICELEVLSVKKTEQLNEFLFNVEIKLLTGRTHQIRAQLSFAGSPIRGDKMYGAEAVYQQDQIDLAASALSFEDPLTQESYNFDIGKLKQQSVQSY